ncbi:hypothetical protein ABIB26_003345 [Arthrobacter sp. UYEF20]
MGTDFDEVRVSGTSAFVLAAQSTQGVRLEHGGTGAIFRTPRDQRNTNVHGRPE